MFDRVDEIIVEQGQRGLRVLREESIPSRQFSNWTFGVIPASSGDRKSASEFLWRFCGLRPE